MIQVVPIVRTGIIVGVGSKYREVLCKVLCKEDVAAAPQVARPRHHTPDGSSRASPGVTPNVSIISRNTNVQTQVITTRV